MSLQKVILEATKKPKEISEIIKQLEFNKEISEQCSYLESVLQRL